MKKPERKPRKNTGPLKPKYDFGNIKSTDIVSGDVFGKVLKVKKSKKKK